jgi:HEAT repeat protein
VSLERVLADLSDESKPIRFSGLVSLSDLPRQSVEEFLQAWRAMSVKRRHKLLEQLVNLVDFRAIFISLMKDDDAEIRELSITGLWECEDRVLVNALLEAACCDPTEKVRAAAAIALGKFTLMAEEGKLSPTDGDRIRETLLGLVKKETEPVDVRRRALEAVAPFNTIAVQGYIRWAYGSQDINLRSSALYAMGKTGDSRWLPQLARELQGPSPALRYEAANACGDLGDEAALPGLLRLLEDDDQQVQLAAVRALGEIGGIQASRALKRLAHSEESALREAAESALESVEAFDDPLAFRYRS